MATVHIVRIENQDDMAGVARPGEPYPRPFVTLLDGRTMTYKSGRMLSNRREYPGNWRMR